MNISGAIIFLLDTLVTLYLSAILLRVILQYVGAPFSNPICQFIVKITNIGFMPLRKIIPGYRRIDFAGVVFAYLVAVLYIITEELIRYQVMPQIFITLLAGIWLLLSVVLNIYFWAIILRVIFSFLAAGQMGYNPMYLLTYSITEPVLSPIRLRLPPMSGFDLSPLVACFVIVLIKILFGLR